MLGFRLFLIVFAVVLFVYTLFVGAAYGWNLVPPFFSEIAAMTWQGQFNLDFMGFLLLSAIWTLWRNNFSPLGWGLSLIAATGGMLFLTAYLMYLTLTHRGNMAVILMGDQRAA